QTLCELVLAENELTWDALVVLGRLPKYAVVPRRMDRSFDETLILLRTIAVVAVGCQSGAPAGGGQPGGPDRVPRALRGRHGALCQAGAAGLGAQPARFGGMRAQTGATNVGVALTAAPSVVDAQREFGSGRASTNWTGSPPCA